MHSPPSLVRLHSAELRRVDARPLHPADRTSTLYVPLQGPRGGDQCHTEAATRDLGFSKQGPTCHSFRWPRGHLWPNREP